MTLLAGGTPVIVNCPSEVGFKLTAEALEKVITKKLRSWFSTTLRILRALHIKEKS